MQRSCGVLMPISSLPSMTSIGDFGHEGERFVDFLAECGFSYWQTLPFCLPDEFHSPYKSYSSFSGNYYFISPVKLYEQDLITRAELLEATQEIDYACEYERLEEERFALLYQAAMRVKDRSAVEAFIKEHPHIASFCRFMALSAKNKGEVWRNWQDMKADDDLLFAWEFTQYEFFRQWKELKAYANEKGVRIIGDIPIYVDYNSSDVWENPAYFDLDEALLPRNVAGCPPDMFAKDGQMWGNPLYNWQKMKEDGYSFWRARLRHMFELFDGVRLDHFRGFSSYWSIPAGAKTAKEGKWMKGPGRAFVDMIKEEAQGRLIIAEDLGEATPDVPKLLSYSGFPGMKVFQFGFLGEKDSPHVPYNYPENCVAYTGTHDNETLLSFIFSMDEGERRRLFAYCNHTAKDWESACDAVIRAMYASHAGTVIFPIQDLLRFGCDTRMNTPGKTENNWSFRTTWSQLSQIDTRALRHLADVFGRLPQKAPEK